MNTEQHRNNPLHGVGLKAMLEELLEHYGWPILAAQLKINSFEKFPSIKSAHKFLHKTQWAREKTEAFYLYKFKQLPIPTDEEHALPPRERSFEADLEPQLPAIITENDREFFDDPVSGPKFRTPFDKSISKKTKSRRSTTDQENNSLYQKKQPENIPAKLDMADQAEVNSSDTSNAPQTSPEKPDPWSKWRK